MRYFDCIFVLILSLLVFSDASVAEWYAQSIYPGIAAGLSMISSRFAFSLYDIFIIVLIIFLPACIIFGISRIISFRKILSILFFVIFGTVSWFYLSWGINYFRPDIYHRMALRQAAFDTVVFANFLDRYIDDINAAFCVVDEIDLDKVDLELESVYSIEAERLGIGFPCGRRRTKRPVFGDLITKMGISGYFGPFFNEVHVNFYPHPLDIPYTLAHEKAHQFGVASEAECNLLAFAVCTASSLPDVRYSGYMGAFGYVFSYARRLMGAEELRSRINRLDQRIISDYKRSIDRWQSGINQGLSEAQSKVYDVYLKTNRIESGISNYSEMVGLLVSFYGY